MVLAMKNNMLLIAFLSAATLAVGCDKEKTAAQQLAKPIASRLKEGVVVTLEGPDYRELLAKQRAAAETGSPSPVVNVANKKREAL